MIFDILFLMGTEQALDSPSVFCFQFIKKVIII